MELNPEKAKLITMAACALHNFILSANDGTRIRYIEGGSNVNEMEDLPSQNLIHLQRGQNNRPGTEAMRIREEFKEYFVSPQGEVQWQYQHM